MSTSAKVEPSAERETVLDECIPLAVARSAIAVRGPVFDKDAATVSAGVVRVRKIARRLGWIREVDGWQMFLPKDAPSPSRGRTCAVCGAPAKHTRSPSLSPSLWGRPRPEVYVPLCAGCHLRTWRRSLGLLAAGLTTGLGAVVAAKAVMAAWPWVPWLAFAAGACAGAVVMWSAISQVLERAAGVSGDESGWRGVPARLVALHEEGWTVHVASRSLLVSLDQVATQAPEPRVVRESDLTAPLVGGAVGVALTATVLWFAWHPEVRILNATEVAMEVRVDGRQVALLAGIPGEAPNAGVDVRVPEGRRVFRAFALDGRLVDETVGWAGRGHAQLYAPGSEGRCFRIEQRAYGRTPQPRPAVLELPPDQGLISLGVPIDAWFQPNPPTQRDLWFSGGVRRSLRLGDCPGQPATPKHESDQR